MDGNPLDEPDGAAAQKRKDWPSEVTVALEQEDKKTVYWIGGVMKCFSSVLTLFNKADSSPVNADDWEIPFADLKDFVYLGAGAQGIVYRATLKGEIVAVKQLRERRELQIRHLRNLNHENIVRFRGVSVDGPIPYHVMEICTNGTLFDYIHSGTYITVQTILKWARDIALGMAYLHSKKIIHRDLKSPNVLITQDMKVKVSDFGTARAFDDASTVMSFTGTVAWMAPEVIRHEPCSGRIDVWSYGVVLWELLTQTIPYKEMESHAIMWAVGNHILTLPIPETCPNDIRNILELCWDKDPKNRPKFFVLATIVDIPYQELKKFKDVSIMTWSAIKAGKPFSDDPVIHRQQEIDTAKRFRVIYMQQLGKANEMFLDVCAVRLQLEQREEAVAEREKAVDNACHCGVRKTLEQIQKPASTSSDTKATNSKKERRRKKNKETQLVVKFNQKGQKTVSVAVNEAEISNAFKDVSISEATTSSAATIASPSSGPVACKIVNNKIMKITELKNEPVHKKNTVIKLHGTKIENNGNAETGKNKKNHNGNYIPDIAHV